MDIDDKLSIALNRDDKLGAVIRGHTHIESYLEKVIEVYVDKKYLYNMKLDYSQKVKLAIGVGLGKRFEKPLNQLGTLRNEFAHKLSASLGKQEINNFYKSFSETEKKVIRETYEKMKVKVKEMGYETDKKTFRSKPSKEQFTIFVLTLRGILIVARKQALLQSCE